MASKELTDLIQSAGAVGDGFVGLTASGELVRRDTVPFDADATPAVSVASDTFVGLTATGDAKLFYAFPYNGPSTSATTPAVTDFVIGRTPGGDARAFTVASLATTLEGTSFGTGAFTNVGSVATLDTGTRAGEVPTNADLGTAAFLESSDFSTVAFNSRFLPHRLSDAFMVYEDLPTPGTTTVGGDALVFYNDGSDLLYMEYDTFVLEHYTCSVPYDLATISASPVDSIDLSSTLATGVYDMAYKGVGDIFVLYESNTVVRVPIDGSGMFGTPSSFVLSGENYRGIDISADGDWMITTNSTPTPRINTWELSTPYDPSTATIYLTGLTMKELFPYSAGPISMSDDGKNIYGASATTVYRYRVASPNLTQGERVATITAPVSVSYLYSHPLGRMLYFGETAQDGPYTYCISTVIPYGA